MYTVTGIDVSDYQGDVDWKKVKASGRDFAFAKATQGTDYVAGTFAKNWHAMKDAGMIRGAYHFAKFSQDPVAQADAFVRVVERQGYGAGDLPLVLDLERAPNESVPPAPKLNAWTQEFMTRVQQLTGRRPILYTGAYFYSGPNMGWSLWLPSYYDIPVQELHKFSPKLPPGFKGFTFWQHSSKMSVLGVSGRVDHNVFNGTLADLKKLAGVVPPVKPKLTLAERLKKAGLGVKSIGTILKKLGR